MANDQLAVVQNQLKSSVFKSRMEELMSSKEVAKEIAFAIQLVVGDEKLAQCPPDSIYKSVFNVATTGLSLNPIKKYATLVPRYNWKTKTNECTLMPMYQGLVHLATSEGPIKKIDCWNVFKGDDFKVTLGTQYDIYHEPKFESKEITHSYAIAYFHDGSRQLEVMPWSELVAARDASETWKAYIAGKIEAKNVIWINWEGEMCRKTVLRRLFKYLPKSSHSEKFDEVMKMEESDYPASASAIGYAESLMRTSTYDDEQRLIIEEKLADTELSQGEVSKLIDDLKHNQQKK